MTTFVLPVAAETDPVASPLVTAEAAARTAADATLTSSLAALAAAGATDVELAAAVATLNAAVLLKQDASTAATDVELAAAVATINAAAATDAELAAALDSVTAALLLKQDAATAASDVELAAAVSTLTAALLGKQDTSTAATDDELATAIATVNAAMATDAEVAALLAPVSAHIADRANPHGVTKAQVGLGSVPNLAAADLPVSTAQQVALDARQPLDSDLTALAGLTPANDDVAQRKAGAWANRTPAQLKTDLGLVKADVGLGNVIDVAQVPASEKAAASGVASLTAASRVVQSPKLHATDHEPGGPDVLTVDAAANVGSPRTLGTGAQQAAQGSVQAAHAALGALSGSPHGLPPLTADNQIWTRSGGAVVAAASSSVGFGASADLTGTLSTAQVAKIRGKTTPTPIAGDDQKSLTYDHASGAYVLAIPRLALQQALAMPTGALSEAGVGRANSMAPNAVLTSGTLRLGGMQTLPKGRAVSTITIASGTAVVTPANQWFCLIRVSDLAVLAKTADDLTAPWVASSLKALSITAPYTPTSDEEVWLGVLVVAATVPTLVGWGVGIAAIAAITPAQNGNSTAGLTNPASLGATAAAPTAFSAITHWGYPS